jgi:hypothetical protein
MALAERRGVSRAQLVELTTAKNGKKAAPIAVARTPMVEAYIMRFVGQED